MSGILDQDLEVVLEREFYSRSEADKLFNQLMNCPFEDFSLRKGERIISSKRKVCSYANPGITYSFSGVTIAARPWDSLMSEIKRRVEESTGEKFNYALLNLYENGGVKIGSHSDNEDSLDLDAEIVTLSFGATRTIIFSRPCHVSRKIALPHGSMLRMKAPTNRFWRHEIAAERVTDARISITFRRMQEQSEDGISHTPPGKRQCVESAFENPALDTFFFSLPPSVLDTRQETIVKFGIGEDVFLSGELYKGLIKTHIRKFFANEDGNLQASRTGVTMEMDSWYDFFQKLSKFNFIYPSACFVANNSIVGLNSIGDEMLTLKSLSHISNSISLSRSQVENLENVIENFNAKMKEYLLLNHLVYFIREGCRISPPRENDEDAPLAELIKCVEDEVSSILKKWHICNGCIIDHPSQRQHDCITLSLYDRYNMKGHNMLLMANYKNIADAFLQKVKYVSENFFSVLNVSLIENVIFKSLQ